MIHFLKKTLPESTPVTVTTSEWRGILGFAVLPNFSCGISVIIILNRGIAVFSKPAECVFCVLVDKSSYKKPFSGCLGRFVFVTHFNLQFDCLKNHSRLMRVIVCTARFCLFFCLALAKQDYYEIVCFSN